VRSSLGSFGKITDESHNVAIPMNQIRIQEGKMLLPGATKEVVKAMPPFQYAPSGKPSGPGGSGRGTVIEDDDITGSQN
jgi:hypothetical protein